jgi:hypothetical protein
MKPYKPKEPPNSSQMYSNGDPRLNQPKPKLKKKTTLLAVGLLLAGAAHANDIFWHPEASEVVLAAPDTVRVCQFFDSPATFSFERWACEDFPTFGARDPFYFPLVELGPVKVWARWAYARDVTGALVPMSRYVE